MKSKKASFGLSGMALGFLWLSAPAADAALLWIDDTANNIGTVDTVSGTVTVKGNANVGSILTDIAFATDGNLYGTSFNNFYSINSATGAATLISPLGVGAGGMNALVGAPGGNLYAASNSSTSLFSVTPSPFGTSTFTGSTGAGSAGDLALAGGFLYESAINGVTHNDELVKLTLAGTTITNVTPIADFNQGATRFTGVFGLAFDGTTMFAVNGTTIYSVDLNSAALTTVLNYSGHGLGIANGLALTVPEPGSLALLGTALAGLGLLRRRKA